ncbi:hypothetical protein KY333_02080 [Candidatus Woesearchaeota archaeon]|nr:hypothetical protein [Candidatus Woesearchaeota archaeon]MBW2994336.1 hypothetical protein [Candidatus Woesearchaeota archaeon]
MSQRENDVNLVKRAIVKKLYSAGCWGKGHMLIERFKSGLPPHIRGEVTSAVKKLIKEKLIRAYGRTKHGLAFYLNISKKKEIEIIIEKEL